MLVWEKVKLDNGVKTKNNYEDYHQNQCLFKKWGEGRKIDLKWMAVIFYFIYLTFWKSLKQNKQINCISEKLLFFTFLKLYSKLLWNLRLEEAVF